MPTYEAVAAILILFLVWGVTRLNRLIGAVLAGALAVACVFAAVVWGVWFGGPVILLGTAIGYLWGAAAGTWSRAAPSTAAPATRS